MAAKDKRSFDKTKGILVVIIGFLVALIIITIPLAKLYIDRLKATAELTQDASMGVFVSLGPLEYAIDADEQTATKRTGDDVEKLRSFLYEEGSRSIEHCESVYHNVIMANDAENQVLLKYGCGYPDARMFAVFNGETWKTISPTNQFDAFGIPACDHVDQHSIDISLAPVCLTEWPHESTDLKPKYRIRS